MTAVQFLAERYKEIFWLVNIMNISPDVSSKMWSKFLKEAKEMEKKQIMHAYGQGVADEVGEVIDATKEAEQYYNQL